MYNQERQLCGHVEGQVGRIIVQGNPSNGFRDISEAKAVSWQTSSYATNMAVQQSFGLLSISKITKLECAF